MGNVQVQYKQRRGANEPGTEVTDPKDWFEHFIEDKFAEFKPQYDQLPDDKKNQFKQIFDDSDVMMAQTSFNMWFNENSDDADYMAEAKNKLMAFMAENQ